MFRYSCASSTPRNLCRALLAFVLACQLTGCSSPEERAKSYYEDGQRLLAANDNQHAVIQFLNAVQYDKKLVPAWRGLG